MKEFARGSPDWLAPSRASATLRQSNVTVALPLVQERRGSYARALLSVRAPEGGEEGLREGRGPNNYINDVNKKNWAALARPIFFHLPNGSALESQ